MSDKKQNNFESPNISKMQALVIDYRTTIYIAIGADPKEAKKRYLERTNNKPIILS
jgi:hypothetical protein